jgi:hypothetical protein
MPLDSNYYTGGRTFEDGDRVMLRPVEELPVNEEVEEYLGIPATVVKGNYRRERSYHRVNDNSIYIDVEFDEELDDTRFPIHQYYPKRFMLISRGKPAWEV